MVHVYGDPPAIAFAVPFNNLSFAAWEAALPDAWAYYDGTPTGTHAAYNPGFDLSPALKISDTGVKDSAAANRLVNSIAMPAYMLNGQVTRLGACLWGDLAGAAGAGYPVVKAYSGTTELAAAVSAGLTSWAIVETNSSANIATADATLSLRLQERSHNSEADPASLFDCLVLEYGRTVSERYYTFAYRPEFHPDLIEGFLPGRKSERGAVGKLREYDTMAGRPKWRVTMPFRNVPPSFVEALEEFWVRNKGLAGYPGIPLVLHHNLTDPAASHTTGHDYLRIPPWIICNISETYWPFKPSGSHLGAKIYSGTLTFEEI